MTVAIIVRENVDMTEGLKERLTKVVVDLILNDWATTFLFTRAGNFDSKRFLR